MTEERTFTAQGPHRLLGSVLPDDVHPALGVIVGGVGEGKTFCLVELGLDNLLAGRRVLHVAVGQAVDHVLALYDVQLDARALISPGAELSRRHAEVSALRMISAFTNPDLAPDRLSSNLERLKQHLGFSPDVLLVDGLQGNDPARIAALKQACAGSGAQLWITAGPDLSTADAEVEVTLRIETRGGVAEVFAIPETDEIGVATVPAVAQTSADPLAFTLLSGGAVGAEVAFGGLAERWGLDELTFTFSGREAERTRGLVVLTEEELAQGDVSPRYLQARMRREYPATEDFRRTLQTIWHQVNTAGEVFVVGVIQRDKTVKGGTGWAAELGKRLHKPVHVFDQEHGTWWTWSESNTWTEEAPPRISCNRFCGTGTRQLSDDGRAALEALFERSFGGADDGVDGRAD